MKRTTDNHNRISKTAAIVISIMLLAGLFPVRVDAFDVPGIQRPGSDRAFTGTTLRKESADRNLVSSKYPEILSDTYWYPGDKKAAFKLNGNSRLYIVIEDEEDAEIETSAETDANDTKTDTDAHVGRVSARLLETVELIASIYAEYGIPGSKPMLVFYGDERYALAGDILIKMTPRKDKAADAEADGETSADEAASSDKADQSYRLDITDKATITSVSEDGIYYGLITLMEILVRADNYENGSFYGDGYSAPGGAYGYEGYGSEGYGTEAYGIEGTGSDDLLDGESADEGEDAKQPAKTIKLKSFSAADGPDLEERAIFLDCGRKYFSPDWIKALIRRSSLQRYNTLILHFSEASALRLESRVFPWMTEDVDHLTMDEMADIVRFAKRYHMNVIPSFDVPGHNKYIVEKYSIYVSEHPDFTFEYNGKTYGPAGGEAQNINNTDAAQDDTASDDFASIANHYTHNGETLESNWIGIDLTKEHAVAFLDAMIDDYAEFFRGLGCTDFDIGGDEVLGYMSYYIGGEQLEHANRWDFVEHWADYAQGVMKIPGGSASDTYIHYLNRTALRLMNMGYTCRAFNDEIDINEDQHFRLLSQIELSYWNAGRRSAQHFAKTRHKLYNCISKWCYFASGRADGTDIMYGKYYTVNGQNIYDNWDPFVFSSTTYTEKPVPEEACAGGYFCIWCDEPDYKSDETIFWETEMRTWANSARMWDARHELAEENDSAGGFGYYDFESFAELVRGPHNYTAFTSEDRQINGSGKPLSGETWYKLTGGLLDWHEKSGS